MNNYQLPEVPGIKALYMPSSLYTNKVPTLKIDAIVKQSLYKQTLSQNTPTTFTDPLLNIRVRRHYREQNERTFVNESLGRIIGTMEGAGIGAYTGLIIGSLVGIGVTVATGGVAGLVVVPAIGAALAGGASAGALGAKIGAGVGAGIGFAVSDYSTAFATKDVVDNNLAPLKNGRVALSAIYMLGTVGKTMDIAGGGEAIRASIYSGVTDTNVFDNILKAYGLSSTGRTAMDTSNIREALGVDLTTVPNFILDFVGDIITDPGFVASAVKIKSGSIVKNNIKNLLDPESLAKIDKITGDSKVCSIFAKHLFSEDGYMDNISVSAKKISNLKNQFAKAIRNGENEKIVKLISQNISDLDLTKLSTREYVACFTTKPGENAILNLNPKVVDEWVKSINNEVADNVSTSVYKFAKTVDDLDDYLTGVAFSASVPPIGIIRLTKLSSDTVFNKLGPKMLADLSDQNSSKAKFLKFMMGDNLKYAQRTPETGDYENFYTKTRDAKSKLESPKELTEEDLDFLDMSKATPENLKAQKVSYTKKIEEAKIQLENKDLSAEEVTEINSKINMYEIKNEKIDIVTNEKKIKRSLKNPIEDIKQAMKDIKRANKLSGDLPEGNFSKAAQKYVKKQLLAIFSFIQKSDAETLGITFYSLSRQDTAFLSILLDSAYNKNLVDSVTKTTKNTEELYNELAERIGKSSINKQLSSNAEAIKKYNAKLKDVVQKVNGLADSKDPIVNKSNRKIETDMMLEKKKIADAFEETCNVLKGYDNELSILRNRTNNNSILLKIITDKNARIYDPARKLEIDFLKSKVKYNIEADEFNLNEYAIAWGSLRSAIRKASNSVGISQAEQNIYYHRFVTAAKNITDDHISVTSDSTSAYIYKTVDKQLLPIVTEIQETASDKNTPLMTRIEENDSTIKYIYSSDYLQYNDPIAEYQARSDFMVSRSPYFEFGKGDYKKNFLYENDPTYEKDLKAITDKKKLAEKEYNEIWNKKHRVVTSNKIYIDTDVAAKENGLEEFYRKKGILREEMVFAKREFEMTKRKILLNDLIKKHDSAKAEFDALIANNIKTKMVQKTPEEIEDLMFNLCGKKNLKVRKILNVNSTLKNEDLFYSYKKYEEGYQLAFNKGNTKEFKYLTLEQYIQLDYAKTLINEKKYYVKQDKPELLETLIGMEDDITKLMDPSRTSAFVDDDYAKFLDNFNKYQYSQYKNMSLRITGVDDQITTRINQLKDVDDILSDENFNYNNFDKKFNRSGSSPKAILNRDLLGQHIKNKEQLIAYKEDLVNKIGLLVKSKKEILDSLQTINAYKMSNSTIDMATGQKFNIDNFIIDYVYGLFVEKVDAIDIKGRNFNNGGILSFRKMMSVLQYGINQTELNVNIYTKKALDILTKNSISLSNVAFKDWPKILSNIENSLEQLSTLNSKNNFVKELFSKNMFDIKLDTNLKVEYILKPEFANVLDENFMINFNKIMNDKSTSVSTLANDPRLIFSQHNIHISELSDEAKQLFNKKLISTDKIDINSDIIESDIKKGFDEKIDTIADKNYLIEKGYKTRSSLVCKKNLTENEKGKLDVKSSEIKAQKTIINEKTQTVFFDTETTSKNKAEAFPLNHAIISGNNILVYTLDPKSFEAIKTNGYHGNTSFKVDREAINVNGFTSKKLNSIANNTIKYKNELAKKYPGKDITVQTLSMDDYIDSILKYFEDSPEALFFAHNANYDMDILLNLISLKKYGKSIFDANGKIISEVKSKALNSIDNNIVDSYALFVKHPEYLSSTECMTSFTEESLGRQLLDGEYKSVKTVYKRGDVIFDDWKQYQNKDVKYVYETRNYFDDNGAPQTKYFINGEEMHDATPDTLILQTLVQKYIKNFSADKGEKGNLNIFAGDKDVKITTEKNINVKEIMGLSTKDVKKIADILEIDFKNLMKFSQDDILELYKQLCNTNELTINIINDFYDYYGNYLDNAAGSKYEHFRSLFSRLQQKLDEYNYNRNYNRKRSAEIIDNELGSSNIDKEQDTQEILKKLNQKGKTFVDDGIDFEEERAERFKDIKDYLSSMQDKVYFYLLDRSSENSPILFDSQAIAYLKMNNNYVKSKIVNEGIIANESFSDFYHLFNGDTGAAYSNEKLKEIAKFFGNFDQEQLTPEFLKARKLFNDLQDSALFMKNVEEQCAGDQLQYDMANEIIDTINRKIYLDKKTGIKFTKKSFAEYKATLRSQIETSYQKRVSINGKFTFNKGLRDAIEERIDFIDIKNGSALTNLSEYDLSSQLYQAINDNMTTMFKNHNLFGFSGLEAIDKSQHIEVGPGESSSLYNELVTSYYQSINSLLHNFNEPFVTAKVNNAELMSSPIDLNNFKLDENIAKELGDSPYSMMTHGSPYVLKNSQELQARKKIKSVFYDTLFSDVKYVGEYTKEDYSFTDIKHTKIGSMVYKLAQDLIDSYNIKGTRINIDGVEEVTSKNIDEFVKELLYGVNKNSNYKVDRAVTIFNNFINESKFSISTDIDKMLQEANFVLNDIDLSYMDDASQLLVKNRLKHLFIDNIFKYEYSDSKLNFIDSIDDKIIVPHDKLRYKNAIKNLGTLSRNKLELYCDELNVKMLKEVDPIEFKKLEKIYDIFKEQLDMQVKGVDFSSHTSYNCITKAVATASSYTNNIKQIYTNNVAGIKKYFASNTDQRLVYVQSEFEDVLENGVHSYYKPIHKYRLLNTKDDATMDAFLKGSKNNQSYLIVSSDQYAKMLADANQYVEMPKLLQTIHNIIISPIKLASLLLNIPFIIQNVSAAYLQNLTDNGFNIAKTNRYLFETSRQYHKMNELLEDISNSRALQNLYSSTDYDFDTGLFKNLVDNKEKIIDILQDEINGIGVTNEPLVKSLQNSIDKINKLTDTDLANYQELNSIVSTNAAFGHMKEVRENVVKRERKERVIEQYKDKEARGVEISAQEKRDYFIMRDDPNVINGHSFKNLTEEYNYLKEYTKESEFKELDSDIKDNYYARKTKLRKSVNVNNGEFLANLYKINLIKKWTDLNSNIETVFRASMMRAGMDTGDTLSESAQTVINTQFIYNNKSLAERYGELVVPFISYPIRASRLFTELSSDASFVLPMYHIMNNMWTGEDQETDKSANTYLNNRIAKGDIRVGDSLVSIGNPLTEAMSTMLNPISAVNDKLNPLMKPVADVATNAKYNRWTQFPIISQGVNGYQGLQEMQKGNIGVGLGRIMGSVRSYESYDKDYYMKNYPQRSYIYNKLYTKAGKSRIEMNMQNTNVQNSSYRVDNILYNFKHNRLLR
ncbi:MAG: hypothetical protein WCR97_04685 [Bacilli bacterium]